MIRLDAALLRPILAHHLGSVGVDRESAEHVVDCLIQTSLRGVDSHGIHSTPTMHLGTELVRTPLTMRLIWPPRPVLAPLVSAIRLISGLRLISHCGRRIAGLSASRSRMPIRL